MHRIPRTLLVSAAIWAISLIACAPAEEAAPDAEAIAEEAAAPLKVYVFDCGEIQVDAETVAIFSLTAEEAGTDIEGLVAPWLNGSEAASKSSPKHGGS